MNMLEMLREEIRAKLDARSAQAGELNKILTTAADEKRTALTEVEDSKVGEIRSTITAIDDEVKTLREREADLVNDEQRAAAAAEIRGQLPSAPTPPAPTAPDGSVAVVRSEPSVYRREGRESFFRDLVLGASSNPEGQDYDASQRLQRYRQEIGEQRANMSRTDGTGGDLVPPLWLMDQYLPLARAGRITAELSRKLPLPAGTDSINIPRLATGTATAEQTDGSSVQKTDATTGALAAPVTTIAGQQVFAMQLLDQSPINVDEIIMQDLMADLATKVDAYVINKAAIGLLNVTGVVAVSYTDASPTVPELYPKIADAIQQVLTTRFLPPQAIVMHPRRWAWFLAALDSQSRPLVVPRDQGPFNAFAGMGDVRAEGSVGSLQGLPVYVDPNIPTNLGAGTNEDRIIVCRFDDIFLWEGDMRSRVLFETDADTLSVRLQVWEYLAFQGARYPKSVAVISGTGLITPTF